MSVKSGKILSIIPYLVFSLAMFLFLAFYAGHIFYYQESNSIFIFDTSIFEKLSEPGGLLTLLSDFLSSLFYFPVAGALILTITTLLTIILINRISDACNLKFRLIPFIFGLGLFWLQTSYKYHYFNSLGILLQLAFFYLVTKKNISWPAVLIFPLWYFLTGGFSWIFFTMMIIHFLVTDFRKHWLKIPVLAVLTYLFVWLIKEFVFFRSSFNIYFQPWSGDATGEHEKSFLAITALICLIPLFRLFRITNPLEGKIPALWTDISLIAIVSLVSAGICRISYDPATNNYFTAERLFYSQNYEEQIRFNIKHPTTNYLTLYENNIALAETGRLNDMLFWFPQSVEGKTLFQKWEMVGEVLRSGGWFYYSIGMINEAHRWAYESMVAKGYNPEELKMLIRTDIINGNYKTAGAYIEMLKKTLFYRKDALRYEKLLYNDKAVDSDPELGPKKKIAPKRDFFATTDDPLLNLKRMVASDSLNRPAFDYLMAYLLITKDYPNILGEWPSLSRYDYARIPIHIEEAGLAINSLNDESLPKINIRVSTDTEQRFGQFLQTFQSFGSDPRAAEPSLRKGFGNTYWYYVFYK